jgi:glycosyltransferase involved in cell wall biosynthesis
VRSAPNGGRRVRIVYVLDNLQTGGTELNAVRTAEHLNRERFDIQFLCLQPDGPLRARLDKAGIPVTGVGVSSFLSVSALRRGREIQRHLKRYGTHVVHAHDPYANVLAAPWARMAGGVAVITSHRWWRNVHSLKVRVANRVSYRFAHRVLANSESVGKLVVRDEGVHPSRLVVVPNFVESSAFEPLEPARRNEFRSRVGLAPSDIAVGTVANLYPVKDQAMLLRAAARVLASLPEIRFVLIGEGAERQALTEQAKALGIADRVLMPGRLAHAPGLPGIFDVSVLTSREEGFPNFVAESMAAGRVVVATEVGGVPDAIVHGQTGLLVRQGDDAAAAESLLRLLNDPEFRDQLATNAARHARQHFHVDTVLRKLESLYDDLAMRYGRFAKS